MTALAVEYDALRDNSLAAGWRARLKYESFQAGDCWIWMGRLDKSGYGRLTYGKRFEQLAHRLSYRLYKGAIPAGYTVDHLCRNRSCVNPDHLEAVTPRENILRGEGIAANRARQTHCKNGHELTPENVYSRPSAPHRRECRTCRSESGRAS